MTPHAAFYCVADDRYFLGAVGLVNSLRLVGHTEPIFLLDCGLTAEQRSSLESEVTVVSAPSDDPPWLLKAKLPLARPAAVTVLIDTDMIVTRSLGPLIESASSGRVVAFEDRQRRYVADWGPLLDLGPTPPGPYLSTGLVFLGGSVRDEVLRLLEDRISRVDFELTFWRRNVREYPFLYGDQDVFNGIVAARVGADRVVALDARLAPLPPFPGLKVADERTLRCAYDDGLEPYVVHHYLVKPWLEPTHHGVYSRLLRRLLSGPGVAVKVPHAEIPLRLRSGPRARGERMLDNARDYIRWHRGALLPGRPKDASKR